LRLGHRAAPIYYQVLKVWEEVSTQQQGKSGHLFRAPPVLCGGWGAEKRGTIIKIKGRQSTVFSCKQPQVEGLVSIIHTEDNCGILESLKLKRAG